MKNVENYLNSVGKQFVKRSRAILKNKGKGGGRLEKSIRANVKETADGYSLQFFMEDYGTFVDKGVKGAGGKIPNGKYKGTWGGRRWFINYKGKRQDSPYKFGTGTGKKDGLTKGIASWTRKKGLQPRSEGGQYMSPKGLNYLIRRNIWIRGIHGISFFQKPLGEAINSVLDSNMLDAIKKDVLDGLIKAGWKKE
tara:strand:- start:173 stop:757 length:585 start_codon:yes stop_codon:yes gene_type:complete